MLLSEGISNPFLSIGLRFAIDFPALQVRFRSPPVPLPAPLSRTLTASGSDLLPQILARMRSPTSVVVQLRSPGRARSSVTKPSRIV